MSRCDIVLLSYENPTLLEKCVMSVLHHTDVPSTLIIVDNNSRDPAVKEFLGDINGNDTVRIEKVFSSENSGFAKGMNKGMRLSTAPYVCILNNDCVATKGWLSEMMKVAETSPDIGIVNPDSNTFGSIPVPGVSIDEYAAALFRDKGGKYAELGHFIGFAALIKREVIDKIGFIDEAYEGVCYEDTDFSVRAQNAGYISALAEGAYVYHKEQASRRKLKNKEAVYAKNRAIFEKRWGKALRLLYLDRAIELFDDSDRVTSAYETLKKAARKRVFVDLAVIDPNMAESNDKVSDHIRVIRHTDVNVRVISDAGVQFALAWKVLTKKKRYDAVVMNGSPLASLLAFLGLFRGTKVFVLGAGMTVSGSGRQFDLNDPTAFVSFLRGDRK
jgi:GT2 family glycosyltransferase